MRLVQLLADGGEPLLTAGGLDMVVREGLEERIEPGGALLELAAREIAEDLPRASERLGIKRVGAEGSLDAPQRLEVAHRPKHLGHWAEDRSGGVEVERELLALGALGSLGSGLPRDRRVPAGWPLVEREVLALAA